MAIDILQMINCYRCPLPFMTMYQGDIVQDTIEALEDLETLVDNEGIDVGEVFDRLPEHDDLDEVIDVLESALEMDEPEMIAEIIKAIDLIVVKSKGYALTRQEIQEEYLNE